MISTALIGLPMVAKMMSGRVIGQIKFLQETNSPAWDSNAQKFHA